MSRARSCRWLPTAALLLASACEAEEPEPVPCTLAVPRVMEVTVVDGHGAPIPTATVRAYYGENVPTDAWCLYSTDGAPPTKSTCAVWFVYGSPGTYLVEASDRGFVSRKSVVVPPDGRPCNEPVLQHVQLTID